MNKRFFALTLFCLHLNLLQAIFPINIFKLGNCEQTTKFYKNEKSLFKITAEGTIANIGHNASGEHVNILQIWQADQNSLTMLRGFDASSNIGALAATLSSASDDGVRGHVVPTAQLDAYSCNLLVKHKLPYNLVVNIALPILSMKLSAITWVDQTKNLTFADQLVKTKLTNNLASTIANLDPDLNITDDWQKTGLGDLAVTMGWYKDFKQPKPILKNVALGLYCGLSIPTGVRKNEDLLMSIPYGNDGSVGIVFGGNIQLQWWQHLRGGINTNFVELLGTNRQRRIKTDIDQTDLLLLAKTETRKEWGFTQQHTLYLEWFAFLNHFALRTSYNYIKHNQDKLSIFNQTFSNEIANTALSLQEWTQHSVMITMLYEGPITAELFYKHPFNGKSAIQSKILGASFGFYF